MFLHRPLSSHVDRIEDRLLNLAALFLALYCAALSLAPAVRSRSWSLSSSWIPWLGYLVWLVLFNLTHLLAGRRLPGRDPYLLPLGALLSGWGVLTIARLYPDFGLRQVAWLAISFGIFTAGLYLKLDLRFLRRYKYLWLTGGILLAGLTLLFGMNPLGYGPEMWLGCCGFYFQPSEPLKLLFVVYLAAYLADRLVLPAQTPGQPVWRPLLPLLAPTLLMTALVVAVLVVQRDLGTASIFIFLYAVMVYLASGRKRVVLIALAFLLLAGLAGYLLFDVVRLRLDAWLNPWLDPSGRSYQIVQSLMAIANGGSIGRGPGLGSPGVVPIPHSDFIFTSITEENGLVGVIALLGLLALLAAAGIRTALNAADSFRRYLAAGLTAYLIGQSILIIGGNIRLLPLTGVTLPFVSYGGSSLLTAVLSLLLLLLISYNQEGRAMALPCPKPYLNLAALLFAGLGFAALLAGWWIFYRGPTLLQRTDNPRRTISDLYIRRGSLLDRENRPIHRTTGSPGEYSREYLYPPLGPVTGYTHPVYGQAGLEASMDGFLRGVDGYPAWWVWWNRLIYGLPPPGLDLRTSLDLELQKVADELLADETGAVVLLNAANGEILAMASHPTFDANQLDATGEALLEDPSSPLLNRAEQGVYPLGSTVQSALASLLEGDRETSPLQAALGAAVISNRGIQPVSRLLLAMDLPERGWVTFPLDSEARQAIDPLQAARIQDNLSAAAFPYWEISEIARTGEQAVTWYLGGTLEDWQGTPFAIAVLLEKTDLDRAREIGWDMLAAAMGK